MIGHTISHYRITGVLHQGTAGTLYAAEDRTLGRRVAINVFSFNEESERSLFRRTVEARSQINHPNVASVFEYGETDSGLSYVVLERITGPSVAELLRRGPLSLIDSVEIAESAAEALSALHEVGVLHQDIKPSNILLNESGRIKIADFGVPRQIVGGEIERLLAGELTERTLQKRELVTEAVAHLAPEQLLRGVWSDRRSDLFALGVTVYEILTGRLPFSGKSAEEIAQKLLVSKPQRPSLFNPRVPAQLNAIVLKTLAHDPELRFQTAEELAEALRSVQGVVRIAEATTDSTSRGETHSEPQTPMLYFTLEGDRAQSDLVEYGSDVNLLFDYAIPPEEALVAFWGERFEKILSGEVDVGVTVIATGFTFRDGVWHKVARFSGGALVEPVRFHLRASEKVLDNPGFFVTLSLYESVLYQLPIRVRLVESLDAPVRPAPVDWTLDLNLYEIISEKEIALSASGAEK